LEPSEANQSLNKPRPLMQTDKIDLPECQVREGIITKR
jgi:hypothetical protein